MYQMFVFDMAGTTVDERLLVYRVLHGVVVRAGFSLGFDAVLRHCGGREKREGIRELLGAAGIAGDAAVVEALYRDFDAELARAYPQADVTPMAYAPEVFGALRRREIRVVLDTGYTEALARQLLERLGWRTGAEFDLLVSADQVARGRPAPDMIHRAMSHFVITDPGRVVKVGDTVADVQEGRNAGCGRVIGVTTGADDRARLLAAGADAVIDSLRDLEGVTFG